MKRLLFFSIGFAIPFLIYGITYAGDCINLSDEGYAESTEVVTEAGSNLNDLQTELLEYARSQTEGLTCLGNPPWYGILNESVGWSGDSATYIVLTYSYRCLDSSYQGDTETYTYAGSILGNNFCTESDLTDTDGDGIPDDYDAYPEDDSDYQYRIMTNYYDADGNLVGQIIVTSNGDYILLGDLTTDQIEQGLADGTYTADYVNSGIWIDSGELSDDSVSGTYAGGGSTQISTQDAHDIGTQSIGSDVSTGSGTTTTGDSSSDGDSDSDLLEKIVNNTAAITSNQEALSQSEILQSELIANGNLIQSSQLTTLEQINNQLEDQADLADEQAETAETGRTSFDNVDVSTYYNTTKYDGTLTEGTDYDAPTDLADESWFTSFFTSNPIKTAFESSGFELTDSDCSMTLTIPGMGDHELSLCEFSDEFSTAGNLLLSLTSLSALIIIAWR